jgi:hypothetical protein
MGTCQCGYETRALAFSCPKCGRLFVEKTIAALLVLLIVLGVLFGFVARLM